MRSASILIAGAGLSGLMMAAQLLRYGVQPVILDRGLGPDADQGHTFLDARNLELLQQLGILKDLMPQGVRYSQIDIEKGRQSIDLEMELGDVTNFPFLLNLPTTRLKKALIGFLTENACKILWGMELRAATEDDAGVWVTLGRTHEGMAGQAGDVLDAEIVRDGLNPVDAGLDPDKWRVDWLIGADGPESLVRRSLGIGVEHKHFAEHLLRAELVLEQDPLAADLLLEPGKESPIRLFRQGGQWVSLFPLSGTDRYLLMCGIPSALYHHSAARSLHTFLQRIIGPLPMGQSLKIIPGTIRVEAMDVFRAQRNSGRRCFLIGDAASGLPKLTGLGNANGLQDAWNLGWKLAGVAQGRIDKKVLLSFQQERDRQGTPDNLSLYGQILNIQPRLPKILKKLEPLLVRWALSSPGLRKSTLFLWSGLHRNYRHSPLSLHYSSSVRIKAGDRFPFLPIYDEKEKTWTDTHRAFRKNEVMLVILGRLSQPSLHLLGQWIKQKYPQGLGLYYLPYSNRNRAVFEAFEMTENRSQGVLVRPDMHIAYMSNSLNIALFDNYLAEILGWKLYRRFD